MRRKNVIWIDIDSLKGVSINEKRKLAFLLKVKAMYVNSRIYNYTPKTLSNKLKVSEYIVKKTVACLEKDNMCYLEGGHLVFCSLNRIFTKNHRRTDFKISPKDNIKSIVDKIDWLLLQKHIADQDYVRKKKSNVLKIKQPHSSVTAKEVRQAQKDEELLREGFSDRNVIGMRKLADILGSSTWKALKLVKDKSDQGLINTRKLIVCVNKKHNDRVFRDKTMFGLSDSEVYRKNYGYYFNHKGKSYRHMGTEIVVE